MWFIIDFGCPHVANVRLASWFSSRKGKFWAARPDGHQRSGIALLLATERWPIKLWKINDILPFSVVHQFVPQWQYNAIYHSRTVRKDIQLFNTWSHPTIIARTSNNRSICRHFIAWRRRFVSFRNCLMKLYSITKQFLRYKSPFVSGCKIFFVWFNTRKKIFHSHILLLTNILFLEALMVHSHLRLV